VNSLIGGGSSEGGRMAVEDMGEAMVSFGTLLGSDSPYGKPNFQL
jgi:hypothetical protein